MRETLSYIIDDQDEAFVEQVKANILLELDKRFPDGVPELDMRDIFEAVLEGYFNGARHAEQLLRDDDMKVKAEASRLQL